MSQLQSRWVARTGTVEQDSRRIRAQRPVYRKRRQIPGRSDCPAKTVGPVRRPRVHSNNYRHQFESFSLFF